MLSTLPLLLLFCLLFTSTLGGSLFRPIKGTHRQGRGLESFLAVQGVDIDHDALQSFVSGEPTQLDLFDEKVWVKADQNTQIVGDAQAWSATIEGEKTASVTLTKRADGSLMATIQTSTGLFQLHPTETGGRGVKHVIQQLSQVQPAPDAEPIPVPAPKHKKRSHSVAYDQDSDSESGIVDVLCVYTDKVPNGQALCQQATAETNVAYKNSGVTFRVRLVHSHQAKGYEQQTKMDFDLNALSSGKVPEVLTLREQFAADFVVMLVDQPDYCGIAYLMSDLSEDFRDKAFAVVHYKCATGYFSFGHELGHAMGCSHNPEASSGEALHDYSFGYLDPQARFRTVMAYQCPNGSCPRRQLFSSPKLLVDGIVAGTATKHDNVSSLNSAAATIMNFKKSSSATREPTETGEVTGGGGGGGGGLNLGSLLGSIGKGPGKITMVTEEGQEEEVEETGQRQQVAPTLEPSTFPSSPSSAFSSSSSPKGQPCSDFHEKCSLWSASNYCTSANSSTTTAWMHRNCPSACQLCRPTDLMIVLRVSSDTFATSPHPVVVDIGNCSKGIQIPAGSFASAGSSVSLSRNCSFDPAMLRVRHQDESYTDGLGLVAEVYVDGKLQTELLGFVKGATQRTLQAVW